MASSDLRRPVLNVHLRCLSGRSQEVQRGSEEGVQGDEQPEESAAEEPGGQTEHRILHRLLEIRV